MTTDLRELLREAREKIYARVSDNPDYARTWNLINRIDAALAEKAPEPVAWREIVRLTDDEISVLFALHLKLRDNQPEPIAFARTIELAMITRLVAAYAALPPASPSDARDAARWRMALKFGIVFADDGLTGEQFTKNIDAAIEREGGA